MSRASAARSLTAGVRNTLNAVSRALRAEVVCWAFLVGIAGVVCVSSSAWSSCSEIPSVEKAFEHADFVVEGRIIDVVLPPDFQKAYANGDTITLHSAADMAAYTMVVLNRWKGALPDTTMIFSPEREVSGGVEFVVGNEYTIYGEVLELQSRRLRDRRWAIDPSSPAYTAFACMRTQLSEDADADIPTLESLADLAKTLEDAERRQDETSSGL